MPQFTHMPQLMYIYTLYATIHTSVHIIYATVIHHLHIISARLYTSAHNLSCTTCVFDRYLYHVQSSQKAVTSQVKKAQQKQLK